MAAPLNGSSGQIPPIPQRPATPRVSLPIPRSRGLQPVSQPMAAPSSVPKDPVVLGKAIAKQILSYADSISDSGKTAAKAD